MCGIVGAVANRNVVSTLIEGLSRLEYRGYDSAGVVVLNSNGIERVRAVGRVAAMQEKVIPPITRIIYPCCSNKPSKVMQ